jgi:biopolymer transport protein ExbB/TolQ
MLINNPGAIQVKRRDFLKATALAGLSVAIPAVSLYSQDPEVINGWYEGLAIAADVAAEF